MKPLSLRKLKQVDIPVRDLVGPAGKDGADGVHGKDGIQGESGVKGDCGSNGRDGEDGVQGKSGVNGLRGIVGLKGIKGDDGYPGVIGPQGAQGEKGDKGDTGEKGDTGDKGDKPKHRWSDTKIQFEKPDGLWGDLVELRGDRGHTVRGPGGIRGAKGVPGDEKVIMITVTSYTIEDKTVVLVDDDIAGGIVTITLPLARKGKNKSHHIKKLGITANVIIDANGSETIDDGLTATLRDQYESIKIVSDGLSWYIL